MSNIDNEEYKILQENIAKLSEDGSDDVSLETGFYVGNNRYQIMKYLGMGSIGKVYRAFDTIEKEKVVLKMLPRIVAKDKKTYFEIIKETKAMVKLNHTNIVNIKGFENDNNFRFIVMEHVNGKSLRQLMNKYTDNQIPEEQVISFALQISLGIKYIHDKGVIHSDIKPRNIMYDVDDNIKIMDFSIAETVRVNEIRKNKKYIDKKLPYLSPEQLNGFEPTVETDVYSFGITLYEMLTGHPPFFEGNIKHQILYTEPDNIDSINPNFNKIIMKCLRKDPNRRYRNFSDIIDVLEKMSNESQEKIPINAIPLLIMILALVLVSIPFISRQMSIPDKMTYVEGGIYKMGSERGYINEYPVHPVIISDFYIGKFEVTQMDWKDVYENNPASNKGDDLPIENISWIDVVKYCNQRSIKEGLTPCYSYQGEIEPSKFGKDYKLYRCDFSSNGYRLPTEAEWEYAARGGNKSNNYKFSGGCGIDSLAWYRSNSKNRSHSVGAKIPNELGIFDMSGNVREWCWDIYGKYKSGYRTNPKGISEGEERIIRGGCFHDQENGCRTTRRLNDKLHVITFKKNNLGFRLVRSHK